MILTRHRPSDLLAARDAVRRGELRAGAAIEASLAAAAGAPCRHAFIRRFDALARAQARAVDELAAAGQPHPPLAGLAVSVKDLFDVAGQPTTAGSRAMVEAPAASDAPAVSRLRAAGAALVGHTNLSEFAFSGVGLNPHHGTPANVTAAALDDRPRVPGGSTSGGAVSVAAGAAWAALGSDTGGSIRIPAALHGLVGFKNTQRLTPLEGCVPLSPTLDTSCAITRSARDAVLLHEVLAARTVRLRERAPAGWRVAVPGTLMLDGLEPAVARAFDRALGRLRDAGFGVESIALEPLGDLAALNADGGFAAAESWAWHRQRLLRDGTRYDPRVARRIRRGEAMSAADYLDLVNARRRWIASVTAAAAPFDALLSPTVPLVAPPIEPLLTDDDAFMRVNGALLRNPSVVNFLDGCAVTLPCHDPGEWPVGLMLWAPAMEDDLLLSLALAVEPIVARTEA